VSVKGYTTVKEIVGFAFSIGNGLEIAAFFGA
jgi:hypothetical protein